MRKGTRKVLYWREGSKIMAAQAEYWEDNTQSGWFKDISTTEMLKNCQSSEEAEKEFRKLAKAAGASSKFL